MDSSFYTLTNRETPFLAFALHDGHELDHPLRNYMLLDEQSRAREEDPYTGFMISGLPLTTVIVHKSRFELDLNRTREKAIYQKPEDAWGLEVWYNLPVSLTESLYSVYDSFHETVATLVQDTISRFGYFLILDVHSYNYKRNTPLEEADSLTHPEINLGTAFNNNFWKPLCDNYTRWLSAQNIMGHSIDARQNIIFRGGAFAQWVTKKFGSYGAVLSVEFKKTFMDEWTGIADIPYVLELKELLAHSLPFLELEIKNLRGSNSK